MSAPTSLVCHHLLVSGKVQGVFYRKHTAKAAHSFGLTGWVRNLPDGRVEIMAEGSAAQVQQLEKWCHTGSPKSRVSGVAVEVVSQTTKAEVGGDEVPSQAPVRQFGSFTIIR